MVQNTVKPLDPMSPAQSGDMSDHLVRVGHLRAIQRAEGWDDSTLARHCGRSPQQVYAWMQGKRHIGERLARSLEERLNLPRYTLDDRANMAGLQEGLGSYIAPKLPAGVTTRLKEVPVLAWTDIQTMLNVDPSTLKQKAALLETFAPASSRAKFLRMPDDSMAGEIAQGDHLLFDPSEVPRAGDTVLVRVTSGEYFVRVFRPRTAYVFEAAPVNPGYQSLTSQDDGALVVAVMIEHRRYRRAD